MFTSRGELGTKWRRNVGQCWGSLLGFLLASCSDSRKPESRSLTVNEVQNKPPNFLLHKDPFEIKEGIHIEFIADISLSIHIETKLRWSEVG